VRFDDLYEVVLIDVGVPDSIGVDDGDGALATAAEAAAAVDPYLADPMDTQGLGPLLGRVEGALGYPAVVAGLLPRVAAIEADEQVALIKRFGHDLDPFGLSAHDNPIVRVQAEVGPVLTDRIISNFDNALRTLTGSSSGTGRTNPAAGIRDSLLRPWQRRHAGRLMRVNHTGEVMAQALYTGQAAGTDDPQLRAALLEARREEEDHLRWCEERLRELRSRPSLLGPIWYSVGWGMGFAAARRGRGRNLGLVVAVEHLVEKHLEEHLATLPPEDRRSREILERMRQDEIAHADKAETLGAQALPGWSESALKALSKIMTRGALWV